MCKATKINKTSVVLFIAEICDMISKGLDLSGDRRDVVFLVFMERMVEVCDFRILRLYLLKSFRNVLPKMQILRHWQIDQGLHDSQVSQHVGL